MLLVDLEFYFIYDPKVCLDGLSFQMQIKYTFYKSIKVCLACKVLFLINCVDYTLNCVSFNQLVIQCSFLGI